MSREPKDEEEAEIESAQEEQREMDPDVECHKCVKLLHISEVEHVRREGIEPEAVPRYFCKSCAEELQEEGTEAERRELQYEAGDRVELFNGRKGTITWSYMSLYENTYDIDLGNGVLANRVAESDIRKVED